MKNNSCLFENKKLKIFRKIKSLFQNMKRNFYSYVMIRKKYYKISTKINKKMINYKN